MLVNNKLLVQYFGINSLTFSEKYSASEYKIINIGYHLRKVINLTINNDKNNENYNFL